MSSVGDLKVVPEIIEKSIVSSLKIQVNTEVNVQTGTSKDVVKKYSIDCLSTLSMKSSAYVGSLNLAFPEKTYLELLNRMIGEKYPTIDASNSDGASEILNIIFANARKEINTKGFNFEPAIPSTVIGKQIALSSSATDGNSYFFETSCDAGPFLVILGLKQVSATAKV